MINNFIKIYNSINPKSGPDCDGLLTGKKNLIINNENVFSYSYQISFRYFKDFSSNLNDNYLNCTAILPIHYFLIVGSFVFFLGIVGIILQRRNIILIFFNIELMFLGVSLNFVTFNYYSDDWRGSIAVLLIVGVAAAESALGLSIVVAIYRLQKNLSVFSLNNLYD